MKIKIETLSPLLMATGESSAHIDADVKYDKYGLPYLSGKTFKGLLRESTREVCEITRETETENIIKFLFGKGGEKEGGVLRFNNLKLVGYEEMVEDLKHQPQLNPKFVQSQFTTIRKQTAIDDGVADDKSLRTYRLIKKGEVFEGEIENAENDYTSILKNALVNLRYLGTRRNRGFGKVKIQEVVADEVKPKPITSTGDIKDKESCKLTYTLTTKSPLQISKPIGDQNTVATEDFIPAQNIRGLIADLLIKNGKVTGKPHTDKNFRNLILKGGVLFHNAIPISVDLIPFGLGKIKTEPEEKRKVYNTFIIRKAKPMEGWYDIVRNDFVKFEVSRSFNFHSSRNKNRIAGRSTDAEIFYYESIDEEQFFKGEMTGDFESLKTVKELLEINNGVHRMGRSKTAQYSVVEFSGININDRVKVDKIKKDTEFYIVFQSPVIVHNDQGMAVPDLKYLKVEFADYPIEIENIISKNAQVETYMGVWRGKTNRENSFAMGTTLKVRALKDLKTVDLEELLVNGIGERTNEGYGRFGIVELCYSDGFNYPKPSKNPSPEAMDPQTETVKKIKNAFDKKENDDKIKKAAIDKSSGLKLNNHQVYRLREKLRSLTTLTEWTGFMESLKDKSAGKTLKKEHLWEILLTLKPDNYGLEVVVNETQISEDAKLYWNTFFNALRKKSKQS
jgi:CRISPR-associated protein Csx10